MAKWSYNGTFLPEIPADVLAEFPYCWISAQTALIVSAYPWHYASGKMNLPVSAVNKKYVLSGDGLQWSLSNSYTDNGGYTVSEKPMWSSHDIPNGSATATSVWFEGSAPIPDTDFGVHIIEFNDIGWKQRRPDVYSVSDGENPFFVNSTFTYNGKETLRSGAITDSGTSETTISFTLERNGYIEFAYTVSSEQKYDWLYVYLDDTKLVEASGTVSWTVVANNLSAGPHTLKVKYTKDVSNSNGSDAGAIGYVKFVGVAEPFVRKYLLRSGSTLYTVTDGALAAISETAVSASVFQTYGVDEIPDGALLVGLTDPEVLFWQDSQDDLPDLSLTVTGAPPLPQVITSGAIDLTHASIAGIDHAEVDASEDVRFAISFDGGTTWKAFDGSAWFNVSDTAPGMLTSTMNAITAEQWAAVATLTSCLVRAWIPAVTSYVGSVVLHYINP